MTEQEQWEDKVRTQAQQEPAREWVRCPDGIHGWVRHPDWDLL